MFPLNINDDLQKALAFKKIRFLFIQILIYWL